MNTYYVLPYKGVWRVKKEKTDEILSIHDTKEEAIKVAKSEIKDKENGNVIVLNADGSIENLGEAPLDGII